MRYERQLFVATVLLCLSITAAYYFIVHQPLERELVQLDLERRRAAQQSIDILNFKNEHGDLSELLLELDEQRVDVERALPTQLSQGEFINYMQSTALANKIQLLEITPGTPARDEALPIIRLPIKIRLECSYFKLLDFLKALEQSERLINIKNFTATSIGDGERLKCELEMIVFAADTEDDAGDQIFDGG